VSAAERLPRAHSPALDAEQLFHEYSTSVYRYCLRRLGSPEEAESQVRAAVAAGARAFDGANDAPAGSVMVRPRAFADLVLPRVADLTRSSADA